MISQLKAALLEHAPEWGIPLTGEWNFLVYNNYQPNYSGINVFWFYNRSRDPLIVTKLYPEPKLPLQEFRNLQDAHLFAPDVVPKPFGLHELGEFWALWMSGIPGTKLTASLVSDAAIDGLCDALVAIQKGLVSKRPANPRRYQDCLRAPLEFVIQHSPAISEACRRVLIECPEKYIERIPVLQQHGDLYAGNVIVNGPKKWSIVDWEQLGSVDLPFYDLIRFLFSLGERPAPDQWHAVVQQHARRILARYMKALGIDPRELTLLLPVLLANWCYRQPLIQGKALAFAALEDCFSQPDNWERALVA